jgi:hypothetical protein
MPVGRLFPINQEMLLAVLANPKPLLININSILLVLELDIAPQTIGGSVDLGSTKHKAA